MDICEAILLKTTDMLDLLKKGAESVHGSREDFKQRENRIPQIKLDLKDNKKKLVMYREDCIEKQKEHNKNMKNLIDE